jgi:2-isopropylmalate synthase
MPYLPIDPKDLGRSYEAVIRVNSQSGKGGIAFLLESEYGLQLPRRLQIEFSQVVQREMDASGKELTAADLWSLFQREYGLGDSYPQYRLQEDDGVVTLSAAMDWEGQRLELEGEGTGPIDAFVQALSNAVGRSVRVLNYSEHAVGEGANAQAIAYVEVRVDDSGGARRGQGCQHCFRLDPRHSVGLRRAPKGSLWPPDPVEMAPDGGNGQWSITLCQALPFLPGRAFYVGNQSVCEVCASVLQKNRMQKFVPRI